MKKFSNRNRVKSTANEVLTLHRKMIESQNKLLSKRNEELIDLNQEKNNFIQILSHDLRAPINNITGLSKILMMDSDEKLDEEQERIINHIAAESRRLNKMVTRILDIEKIESKKCSKTVFNVFIGFNDKNCQISLIFKCELVTDIE